jgi:two-component system nitrate/nitrite sensor histidine kinase NarX
VLGYVNTQTLAIKKLLSSGRGEEAERQVADMETTARRVYTDVREAILGLRTSQGELLPTLRAYVADYARMTGIDGAFEVGADVEALRLPPAAEIQLVRIVQEALANVRKHAQTGHVAVRLQADGDVLALEVADDGRGFVLEQPRRTGWPHFGLQTMRERAEAIGGAFELDSAPGAGTRVRVRVPATQTREIEHAGAAR